MQIDLFDSTAVQERDAGLQAVSENNSSWMDRAFRKLGRVLPNIPGGEATAEAIKIALRDEIEEPQHHNAWGALIRKARHRKILTPTGRWTRCCLPKSHARQTPIYRINLLVNSSRTFF